MTNKEQTEQFRELYGAPARHSDYSIGQSVSYTDHGQASGKNSGKIVYIAESTDQEPQRLIITPMEAGFPVEVSVNEVIIEK